MIKFILALSLFMYHFDAVAASQNDNCMAIAIHNEASKTSPDDQRAVYEVIRNRAITSGKSVCKVIREPYQFSFVKPGMNWTATKEMMKKLRAAEDHPNILPAGTIYFHASYVKPAWAKRMRRVACIGVHRYYVPRKKVVDRE